MKRARSARERNPLLILLGILTNRCPQCLEGPVWRSLLTMHDECSQCRFAFNREEGYFTNAMVISYGFGAVAVLPLFLVLAAKSLPVWQVLGIPCLVLLVMAPFSVRYSRLLLLHTDPTPFEDRRRTDSAA